MSRLVWCEKSTALAVSLHQANIACEKTEENNAEVLAAIGKAVAAEVKHTGIVPNANSVRSKLAATKIDGEKVYQAVTNTTNPSKKGQTESKAQVIEKFAGEHGLSDISTLANANAKELTTLINHINTMKAQLEGATAELAQLVETYES